MIRTDQQIVDDANTLARKFYELCGYIVKAGYRFDQATHPYEIEVWNAAIIAFEFIGGIDVRNALDEIYD